MPMLEKSEQSTAQAPHDDNSEYKSQRRGSKDKIERDMDKQDAWAEIKPYTKSLTPSDVEACVKLEDATFPPQERATKEKVSVNYETLSLHRLCFKDRLCLPALIYPILQSSPASLLTFKCTICFLHCP